MKDKLRFVSFGALFGFILSRAGATDFDAIHGMFLFDDLHLAGVIGVAIAVIVLGQLLLPESSVAMRAKPLKPGTLLGSAMFGAGWAISGTCPGTGLAQLGEGRVMALFTVAGMFVGVALYRRLGPSLEARLAAARAPAETVSA